MLSLDANILFYAADKAAGSRHILARQLLDDAAGPNAALTEQSLFEFFHSSTRKGKIPVSDATIIVQELAKNFTVMIAEKDTLAKAFALFQRYALSIWDARVLAVCEAHDCEYLLSEDMQDGGLYGKVHVVNPFVSKNAMLLQELLSQ